MMKKIVYTSLVITVLIILLAGETWAEPPITPPPGNIVERIEALENRVAALEAQNATQNTVIEELMSDLTTAENTIVVLQEQIEDLESGVGWLSDYVSLETGVLNELNGPHVIFTGANFHIRSGSGSTGDYTGLGNLIMGYNEEPVGLVSGERDGSHSIIIGRYHRFMGYSGLVAGSDNTLNANYAIVGGEKNYVGGTYSIAIGGSNNEARAGNASITGGKNNVVGGAHSSITGGSDNEVPAAYASVSGGYQNVASGAYTSVTGGSDNEAGGSHASISGGYGNSASNYCSSVSGGGENVADGQYSSVSGGFKNKASYKTASDDVYSSVSGGTENVADGLYSSVSGGSNNTATSDYSSVVGDAGVTYVDATIVH